MRFARVVRYAVELLGEATDGVVDDRSDVVAAATIVRDCAAVWEVFNDESGFTRCWRSCCTIDCRLFWFTYRNID